MSGILLLWEKFGIAVITGALWSSLVLLFSNISAWRLNPSIFQATACYVLYCMAIFPKKMNYQEERLVLRFSFQPPCLYGFALAVLHCNAILEHLSTLCLVQDCTVFFQRHPPFRGSKSSRSFWWATLQTWPTRDSTSFCQSWVPNREWMRSLRSLRSRDSGARQLRNSSGRRTMCKAPLPLGRKYQHHGIWEHWKRIKGCALYP